MEKNVYSSEQMNINDARFFGVILDPRAILEPRPKVSIFIWLYFSLELVTEN